MAFFPGQPGFPGFNQVEANVQMTVLVQQLKSDAEMKLQSQDYQGAYDGYSHAFSVACRCPITHDEIPKIICNRSMVLYKMRRYREALADAVFSINDFPYWIKGYWRACQAEKELGHSNRAVEILINGLNACAAYSAPLDDQISLFTEMVTLLCQVRGLKVQRLQSPDEKSTKAKIILRLISNKAWEGVSYLVTGEYTGDNMDLAATFSDLNFSFVHVGNLLKETTTQQRRNWGIELAVALLKKGASFQQMEFNYGQAAVHIGVQTALETGNVDLLKFLLSTYIDSKEKKNIIDKNGDTAIHVVVKSGISNGTLGETVLRLLMNSGCTAYLKDMSGKLPVDYLKPTDQGFTLLQTAKNNSDEEIRKKVIIYKGEGNNALKENNNGKAIQMYTKGLELCGENFVFKRDAAVLLSNRSNVYSMMGMNREALKDAVESIKSDNTWYKGYWRKGQELKQMKRTSEAYTTFLEMFKFCNEVHSGDKLNFMTEAVMLFKDIPDRDKREKYKLLALGDHDLWTNILNRMSKSADWLTIRYLLMGMSTTVSDDPNNNRGAGVAAQAATNRMSFGTVFEFLKTVKHMQMTVQWLTPTLVVLLYKHTGNFLSLLEDDRDTCVHAAVRYSVITGSLALLHLMPITSTPFRDEYLDGRRETPYHIITKYKHTSDVYLMIRVANVLIEKRFTASMTDLDECLAIDFVSEETQKPLYDVLAKITWKVMPKSKPTRRVKEMDKPTTSSSQSVNNNPKNAGGQNSSMETQTKKNVDPQALKEMGNTHFKNKSYYKAMEMYSEAIDLQKSKMKAKYGESRDLAVLFGNRSECFLKMLLIEKALEDAVESVSYDGHWFKAHMKVGKAQAAKENHELALQAYTNALNELSSEPSPEKAQREILASYCVHYMHVDKKKYPVDKKVTTFEISTHLWALVTYDFISNGNWDIATFSYIQFKCDPTPTNVREVVNLKPMCELRMVQKCAWCIDLMEYFLMCGSDYNTMKTYPGDRYFHAAVKLTIVSERIDLLENMLSNIVIPKKDQNLLDDKRNTALHVVTKADADGVIRVLIIEMLLKAEVNPLVKNNDGKYAIAYLPRGEGRATEILHDVMKQQEDIEKKIKQQKLNQQRQQEAQKKQTQYQTSSATNTTKQQGRQTQQNSRQQQDDSWKQSFMPKTQPTPPNTDRCRRCERVLEECRTKINTRTTYAYFDMAQVIREKSNHIKEKHQKIVDEMLVMITESVAKTLNPEIPEKLAKIPWKYYNRIVNGLVKGENWRQLDVMVDEYRKYHGPLALANYAKDIKLHRVIIHSSLKGSYQLLVNIILSMLKSGAVMEKEGKKCIQAAVQEEQYKILETLFNQGACPSHLSVNTGDTPVHAALSIAIERDRGNFAVFNLFLQMFENDPEKYQMLDPSQQDKNGDCLFHLVAKVTYNSTVQKATELLCDKKISSNVKNNENKLPIHYLNIKKDRRLQFFRLASFGGPTKVLSKKPKPSKSKNKEIDQQDQKEDMAEAEENDLLQYTRADDIPQREVKSTVKPSLRKEALRKRIEELIYGLDDVAYSKYSSRLEELEKTGKKTKPEKQEPQVTDQVLQDQEPVAEQVPPDDAELESDEEESLEEQFQFDPQVFENLEWEIECTADVWKALRDKHVLPELKQRIVRKIQHLAAGEWTRHLCKKLKHNVPETLRLYEAKITKGGRIIWELAIAFSPRLSESAEMILECNDDQQLDRPVKGGKIYSEIIRVWDIVFDHGKIYNSVQRIIKSHTRGESCIIQKKLRGMKRERYSDKTNRRFPRKYAEAEIDKSSLEEVLPYFPPASANDTEYHILKFYSFSSNLVSHILQNIEIKVDFPFRVTDLEHAIINLQSNAPILLLGRSGTGKTTCCLYRLWSRFLWYWTKAKEADAPLLPRCVIYRDQEENKDKEEGEEEEADTEGKYSTVEECRLVEEEIAVYERQMSGDSNEGTSAAPHDETEGEEEVEEIEGQQYDHLHQIFITKNAVLCNEVQKNFRELMHACDVAKNHLEAETQNLPNRLQDVTEYQFPLFITSRQLLLMLDASLDPPNFFDRAEDGSLKVDIQGWTDGDGPLSILPLLQEGSDDEDESEEEEEENLEEDQENQIQGRQNRKKTNLRKEMTYELFSESIWPHMNKGVGKKYHPSLVWTEIMSFIKGSYEALSKPSGCLDKEEYIDLGRKRAPNFSGEREDIYTLFKRYEHVRKQKFLFDETDLVRDVYHRLCKQHDMTWIIHQIFVDETQDFTQAELCLLLRLCQNPNEMFLTGDTAQSIMRGIAFRFSDLKSLFYYASKSLQAMGKTSGVAIPKQVYQLTHNYRSHAGILSMASSILDLMIEFFPESFDRLNKDQGLFHGPQPVILESCSFSDLALLLRGNKRKTSHIEFGAHQAILVVNDAARENVPEELQYGLILTIYEAKGLEFDDVLLYNFFKDSQASKEWRVVTDFLERLCNTSKSGTESLVQVGSDFLQQKDRPRSLAFDPNQHKILNSELKHLYTAVTRARVNVWIFDEDMEKRAPMFEYFKARQLVKAIINEDVQNVSTGSMFAEESTPQEWLKRAQDFMKHNLYEVAAKCYRQGLEPYMEKVAMSHQRALKASRIKDNPAKMREEFLLAAEQYLEVNLPVYAAKCLQNARERELLAHLYEKIGQLEKAAETYRKLRRPIESSACYERMGYFDKAIDTLFEQELYDMAFDTLKRFRMQKKEFEEQGKQLPQHLKDHAPLEQHTEEQLAYMAANVYHANKNVGKMLASLNRLSILQDRVNFLKKNHNQHNEYLKHAAKILRDSGQVLASIHLYLDQGEVEEALSLARDQGRKELIGYCLIVQARMEIRIQNEGSVSSDNEEIVIVRLKEAFELFKNLDQSNCYKYGDSQNGAGEASLLLGLLTNDIEWINLAWGAFNKAIPRNEAGQLECMHWMVYNSDLSHRQNLVQVVRGMRNLYGVLKVTIIASSEDGYRLDLIWRFYGLEKGSDDRFTFNPRQKPRILDVLKAQGATINEKQLKSDPISRDDARYGIAQDLLMKGKQWYIRLQHEFNHQHRMLDECPLFRIGIKDQCQTPCSEGHHTKLSNAGFNELVRLDLLFIEMECYVDDGCRVIDYKDDGGREKVMPEEHRKIQNSIYNLRDKKYSSCKLLLRSIFLRFRHTGGITISTKSDVYRLKMILGERRHFYVRKQLERMLGSRYDKVKDKANKIREKNTELFMNMVFLMNFFKIEGIPLKRILREFEHNLQTEYNSRHIVYGKLVELGLLFENDLVHCVVRRFMDVYELLSSANNSPDFALRKFSIFIQLIKRPNHIPMLPDLCLLTMWIEFFMVTAFCLECKFTATRGISFVIPSSYLSVVNLVDSSILGETGVPTLEAINRYNPHHAPEQDLFRNRTERLVGIMAGTDSMINLIEIAFSRMSEAIKSFQPWGGIDEDHPTKQFKYSENMIDSILVAERVLVASLVFLCNMDKTVYTDSETHVIGEICRISIPDHCPDRLVHAVQKVQKAKGIADIVLCLKGLLEERGETLLQCTWEPRQKLRHGISPETVIDMSAFLKTFHLPETTVVIENPNTIIARHAPVDDEEITMTAEEKEKFEAEHQAFEEAQKREKCANTILNFFRHVQFLSNCQNLRELCEKEQSKEKQSSGIDIFKYVVVNEDMCGICGEYFKVEERIIEKEMEVQDMFTGTQSSLQVASVSDEPTVPESYSSILKQVFTNVKGYVLGTETQQSIDSASRQSTVDYATSSQSQQNLQHENFPSLSETHANILDGLTPLQKHERSFGHLEKQQDYKMFQNRYLREFKTDVEKMKNFIEKYELNSTRVKKLYPDWLLAITHVTSAYDKVMQHISKIIETRNWRDNDLHQSVKEMMGSGNDVYQYVVDMYSKQSKISTKKAPRHNYTTDNDYDDEFYDEFEPVVPAPKTKEFVNSKYKKKKGR